MDIRHINYPNIALSLKIVTSFFFLSLCPLQVNIILTSNLLTLKTTMWWCCILSHQHFRVCVSQSKQLLVYSERARTGLLEELGQALCRLKFRLRVHDG